MKINGYFVVRKPEQNYDEEGRGAYSPSPPHIDSLYYGGINRMEWFDILEDYYNNTLPTQIKQWYQAIDEQNIDYSGINVCTDFKIAKQLLAYSNKNYPRNELIAIHSDDLGDYKHTIVHNYPIKADLGFDYTYLGNWSLIEGGIFANPTIFKKWLPKLNKYGLFPSNAHLEELSKVYTEASKQGNVEPIEFENPIHIALRIYRVL